MLNFRFHHFFCTLGFQGKGYSDSFVQNFSHIKKTITDDSSIRVTSSTDDICAPCPHKRDSLCEQQPRVEKIDQAHAQALDLKEGDVLTWGDAKKRLSQLTLEKHKEICNSCEWLDLGVCASALQELKENGLSPQIAA